MPHFDGAWWELTLPEDWEAQHEIECSSMFSPLRLSALQVSAARKETPVDADDLLEFAQEHIGAGAQTTEVALGEFEGFTFRSADEDLDWRHWYLRNADVALFVTYNCPRQFLGREDVLVDSVLATLRRKRTAL
jgi:hypothetical protein